MYNIQMMFDARSDPHYCIGSVALMDCGAGGVGVKVVILRRRSRVQLSRRLGKAYMAVVLQKHEYEAQTPNTVIFLLAIHHDT